MRIARCDRVWLCGSGDRAGRRHALIILGSNQFWLGHLSRSALWTRYSCYYLISTFFRSALVICNSIISSISARPFDRQIVSDFMNLIFALSKTHTQFLLHFVQLSLLHSPNAQNVWIESIDPFCGSFSDSLRFSTVDSSASRFQVRAI